jgi:hypothetical protein
MTQIVETALTLREAAKLLNLAYSTVFAKRKEIGFRLPGSRVWRVWPSRLAEFDKPRDNVIRLSVRVGKEEPCPSAKIKPLVSISSTSALQAAKELDDLLKQRIAKPRRNITTS